MSKRLFVGGLAYTLTEADLIDLFSKIGEVATATLIKDKFTGQSKGFAFVEMVNDADADKAMETLHDTEVAGRKIAVNLAKPREDRGDSRGGYGGGRDFNRGGNDRNFDRRGGGRDNFRRSH